MRRIILLLTLCAASGATAAGGDDDARLASASEPPRCRPGPLGENVRSVPGGGRRIALTFDDGPSEYTSPMLDVLREKGAKATFFVVGENVRGREDILRRQLAEGHLVGNHSFSHQILSKADRAAMLEISRTQAAIRRATGYTPCFIRPPAGRISLKLSRALAERRMTSILWSLSPGDYRRPGVDAIRDRVLDAARPGAIVAMHDGGGDQTLRALPSIIDGLQARGYRLVTVAQLLR